MGGDDNIVDDLIRMLSREGVYNSRMRLAVTPAEFQQIRESCLERYGVFYARLRNVVLIVENDPDNPPIFVEHAKVICQAM